MSESKAWVMSWSWSISVSGLGGTDAIFVFLLIRFGMDSGAGRSKVVRKGLVYTG